MPSAITPNPLRDIVEGWTVWIRHALADSGLPVRVCRCPNDAGSDEDGDGITKASIHIDALKTPQTPTLIGLVTLQDDDDDDYDDESHEVLFQEVLDEQMLDQPVLHVRCPGPVLCFLAHGARRMTIWSCSSEGQGYGIRAVTQSDTTYERGDAGSEEALRCALRSAIATNQEQIMRSMGVR